MAKKPLVECRNRQPLPGEELHADLLRDPAAKALLDELEWLIEPIRELASPECPEDLSQSKYYQAWQRVHSSPSFLLAWTQSKQAMLRECLRTGYELVGWPVIYRDEQGGLRRMDGMHRLALKLGQGVPVRAIVQGERAKPDHS